MLIILLCPAPPPWWPSVTGDLFDMLLPMLGIYQEYVRNHHYSLQVLAEYKQNLEFGQLLRRYEEKPICENRSLETFLTYPMHQASPCTLHLAYRYKKYYDSICYLSLNWLIEKLSVYSPSLFFETYKVPKFLANMSLPTSGECAWAAMTDITPCSFLWRWQQDACWNKGTL